MVSWKIYIKIYLKFPRIKSRQNLQWPYFVLLLWNILQQRVTSTGNGMLLCKYRVISINYETVPVNIFYSNEFLTACIWSKGELVSLHIYGDKTEVLVNHTKPRTRHCGLGHNLSTQVKQLKNCNRVSTQIAAYAVREQINASAARLTHSGEPPEKD